MSEETTAKDPTQPGEHVVKTRAPLWMLGLVTGVFGLLFAYSVWSAVAALVTQASGQFALTGMGWAVMIAAIVVPVVLFALAVWFGFRRAIGEYALILLAAFALAQVYWINTVAFMFRAGCSLVSGNPFCS